MKKKQPQTEPAKCPSCGWPLAPISRTVMTERGEATVHITCSDAMVKRGEAVYIEPQSRVVSR